MGRLLGVEGQARRRVIGHAVDGDKGQAGAVGVREERRPHRRAQRPGADGEERPDGRFERIAGTGRRDGGRQAGTGIAGRSVAGHGRLLHAVRLVGGRIVHRRNRALTRRGAPPILRRMKLVVAVVHTEDAAALVDALLDKEFRATRLHSSGGFLKQTNATILLGVEDAEVDEVMAIVRENCTSRTQVVNPMPPIMEPGEFFMPYPLEVEVGGATVFVVPVERFERL
jgi:uncharacterized protein YaaQ